MIFPWARWESCAIERGRGKELVYVRDAGVKLSLHSVSIDYAQQVRDPFVLPAEYSGGLGLG